MSDEIADLVMKIIGEIEPVGETNMDEVRYAHLEVLLETLEALIDEVRYLEPYKDRHEYSMKKAGDKAMEWVKYVHGLMEKDLRGDPDA